jgi:hypothetical protein
MAEKSASQSKHRMEGELDRVSHFALTAALVAGIIGMLVGNHYPLFGGESVDLKHSFLFANVAFFVVMLFCKYGNVKE